MPGFSIGGSGDGPPNSLETMREHRWEVTQFGPIMQRELLRISKEVDLPGYAVDVLEILGGAHWYKFAKGIKWKDVTITFYDDGRLLPQVESWKDMVYTNESGILVHTPGSGYKQDVTFELLDGQGSPVYSVILRQAWPSQIMDGKLSHTSSEIKIITVILSYDYAEVA